MFLQFFYYKTIYIFIYSALNIYLTNIHLILIVYVIETLMQASFKKTINHTDEINETNASDARDNQYNKLANYKHLHQMYRSKAPCMMFHFPAFSCSQDMMYLK